MEPTTNCCSSPEEESWTCSLPYAGSTSPQFCDKRHFLTLDCEFMSVIHQQQLPDQGCNWDVILKIGYSWQIVTSSKWVSLPRISDFMEGPRFWRWYSLLIRLFGKFSRCVQCSFLCVCVLPDFLSAYSVFSKCFVGVNETNTVIQIF